MLIAASWPSNREAAVTKRSGGFSVLPEASGKSLAAVLMERSPPTFAPEIPLNYGKIFLKSIISGVAKILICIKIIHSSG
jgi:hypothetical protein